MKKAFFIIFLVFLSFLKAKSGFSEYFYSLDSDTRRLYFIEKINELLDKSFLRLEAEQAFVRLYFKRARKVFFRQFSEADFKNLLFLRKKYRIKELYDEKAYILKIAKVPKALALAQAIIESASGSSRFTRLANNLFGEWTWSEPGLIPKNREEGKRHKIRIFKSLQASVDSYILNLNRHFAYKDFRKARYDEKDNNFSSLKALKHLHSYSEQKNSYLKLVEKIILQEKLLSYE